MKKFLILILLFFATAISVNADAGNNVRYSSGSSSSSRSSGSSSGGFNFFNWGSSSDREYSGSYSSSSNYRSSSSSSSSGGVIEAVSTVVFLALIIGSQYRGRTKSYDANEYTPTIIQPTREMSKVYNNPQIAKSIIAIDENFDEKKFLAYASEVYVALQEAWTAKSWEAIRQFESEALYNTHATQLQEYIRRKKTNVVERIAIRESALEAFNVGPNFEELKVYMYVILRDYVIDDASGSVLEGNPMEDIYVNYELVFIRNKGQKTRKDNLTRALECPSCGAHNSIKSDGICEYCGNQRVNDWVLNSIKSI